MLDNVADQLLGELNSIPVYHNRNFHDLFIDPSDPDPIPVPTVNCSYFDHPRLVKKFVNEPGAWLASLNIQSLQSKHFALHQFLNDHSLSRNPPLAVALQETWAITDPNQVKIPNYNFVHLQRPTRGGGGGFLC